MEQRFLICEHCGNIIAMVKDSGVPVMCCGQKMTEIIPGTSDGAVEKHLPVWTVEGNTVKVSVGSVEHPIAVIRTWFLIEKHALLKRMKISKCLEMILLKQNN